MMRIPLTPIITHRIREDRARAVEARRRDRLPHLRIALEAVLCVFIPEVERAVGAGGAERAVDGVERDCVDGEDVDRVAGVGGRLAVALEGEVVGRVFFLNVVEGAAAFDGADGEAGRVDEAADDPRLPF